MTTKTWMKSSCFWTLALPILLTLGATSLCSAAESSASSSTPSDVLTAEPPAWQENDDEIIETTVGAMRTALWWYDYAQALRIAYASLSMDYTKCLEDSAVIEGSRKEITGRYDKALRSVAAYRVACASLATGLALVLVVVVLAVGKAP